MGSEKMKELINQPDNYGRTPLLWIQRNREGAPAYEDSPPHMPKQTALDNIELLLKRGADPTKKDSKGYDAFHWANEEEKALFKRYGYQQQQQQPMQQRPMQPQQVAAQIARTQAPQPTPPPFVSQQPRCNHRSQHSLVNNRYNRNLRNKQPDSNRLMRTKH